MLVVNKAQEVMMSVTGRLMTKRSRVAVAVGFTIYLIAFAIGLAVLAARSVWE